MSARGDAAVTSASWSDRRRARLATLLSFSSFFVFPAIIPLGKTVALAVPYLLAALLTITWLRRLRTSECRPFVLLMAPLVIAGYAVLIAGDALAPDIVPKTIVFFAMACLIVIPTFHLLRAGYGEQLILGAAFAILVHAALGGYQALAFEAGQFPFGAVMATNPGMAMSEDAMQTYATYIRRPMGLFAEPSAMAACVGPWLVAISSVLFTKPAHDRIRQALLAIALAAGLALVIVSKSGLAVPIAAGVVAPPFAAAFSGRRGALSRAAVLVVSLAVVIASAMWLIANMSSRFDMAHNDSWQIRLSSLEVALRSLETNFVFGVGPGQSVARIQSAAHDLGAIEGVGAVYSVTLAYVMENGVVALVPMLVLGASMVRSIGSSDARVAGAACAAVWFAGLSFGTSYAQQPALWTAMAMLLSWDSVAGRVSAGDKVPCEGPRATDASVDGAGDDVFARASR